ncbi:MAG: hypothetical protein PGN24_02700 [Microbacterium arborescens]
MTSVLVDYITADGVFVHEVEGDPNEPFLIALTRALGPAPSRGRYHFVVESEPGRTAHAALIDGRVTVAQVDAFADGDVICVDSYGRGGTPVDAFMALAGDALTLAGIVGTAITAYRKAGQVVGRDDRRAAREWLTAGLESEPSMKLIQAVKRESEWTPAAFERTFGLGTLAGATLLRKLGYVHETREWRELWVDRSE